MHLTTLKKERKPRFVNKSKRKAVSAALSQAVLESQPPPSPPSRNTEQDSVPIWRYEKEQALDSNEGPEMDLGTNWTQKKKAEMLKRDWRIMRQDLGVAELSSEYLPLLSWDDLDFRLIPSKWKEPTPIQRAAIPVALSGRDVVGVAQTGSGKTGSFGIPIAIKNMPSIVIAPTRELADQISRELRSLRLEVVTLVGGHSIADQFQQLQMGWKVIVSTPGRLLDCLDQHLVSLEDVRIVVLDEADRMVDMGFESQINAIWGHFKDPQTLMYTATWPPHIQQLADRLAPKAEKVVIKRQRLGIKQIIEQPTSKLSRLRELLNSVDGRTIVFANRQSEVDSVTTEIMGTAGMHGGKSQADRESVLQGLRDGSVNCLVATDVAGRGIDVPNVKLVVNFDMPSSIDTYIHRVGRTGRAGKSGRAISFVTKNDTPLFPELIKALRESGNRIPSFLIPNFDEIHD